MKKAYTILCFLLFATLLVGCQNSDESGMSQVIVVTPTPTPTSNPDKVIEEDRIRVENGKIIKIANLYQVEETLVLPDGVTSIDPNAFLAVKPPNGLKTLHFRIPLTLKLQPENFAGCGPMHITFETGRTKIEKAVFKNIGHSDRRIKITLPPTIEELEEEAFYGAGDAKLILNDGLKIIGKEALHSATCNLPDSIEVLKEGALDSWEPCDMLETTLERYYSVAEIHLPDSLKRMEKNCLLTDTVYPRNPIYVPESVRYIAKNAIVYLGDTYGDCKPIFYVDPENKWYYSDSRGQLRKK